MSVWDISTPAGSENKMQGAPRIREMKQALQDALANQGIFPGGTPASPVFIPTILSGTTAQRPTADSNFTGRWYYNSSTGTIQRDNGSSWDDLTCDKAIIPAGTAMLWFETAAPTGWTQVTSGIADRLVRVTTGSGGVATAGDSVSSPPTHSHNTQSANASHTHDIQVDVTVFENSSPATPVNVITVITTPSGNNDVAHAHSLSSVVAYSPNYQNCIVCTRN